MKMDERIFPDLDALSRAALNELLGIVHDTVTVRGRCAVALSGGHTPARMYELWAREYSAETPWDQVHLFLGDERYVPSDDPQSNFRMVRETLISLVPIPRANIHPYLTALPTPAQTAMAYELDMRDFFWFGPARLRFATSGTGSRRTHGVAFSGLARS